MSRRSLAFWLGLGLLAAFLAAVQGNSLANPAPQAKPAMSSGEQTFRTSCAPCHGLDAKGTGPVVPVLRYKPSDLTALSKRNGGTFPAAVIEDALEDNHLIPAHGSSETPIWGDAFRNPNQDETKTKIHNLVLYIQSLQGK